MKIEINDKDIPFELENEEYLGDVLPSIKQYLLEQGHLVIEISVDEKASMISVDEVPISSTKLLSIKSAPILELEETIHRTKKLLGHLQTGEGCSSGCEMNIFIWAKSVEFWLQNFSLSPEFFNMLPTLSSYIAGKETALDGIENKADFYKKSLQVVQRCLEERNAELEDPVSIMQHSLQALVEKESAMRDLGIALQSHQDSTSAYEILLLIEALHKVKRINQLLSNEYESSVSKIELWLDDMAQLLPQLIEAFDRKDFVLVSDLAEYEVAERLVLLQDIMGGLPPKTEL